MFKYAKSLLDKGIQEEHHRLQSPAFETETATYDEPQEEAIHQEEPETVIGENVSMKGTLSFERLLRVDGTFEGEIESKGKLIVGPKGLIKAHIDLQEALIAGKVEGDITVKEKLTLRGRAEVRGNITAPLLTVDEGVSIIGQVYVTAPERLED